MRGATQMKTDARPIQQSRTFLTDLVLPPDTNHHHTIFGGKVMAYVTWTHKTSMEVFVRVEAENLLTGEKRMTARAYLTMTALDDQGKPTLVPNVIPNTEEERHQYEKAKERHALRKRRKAEL